ncbi:MAG: PIN domain-containing protein [bacterium]
MLKIRMIFLLLASFLGYLAGIRIGSPPIGILIGIGIGGGFIGCEFLLRRIKPKTFFILCLWLIIGLLVASIGSSFIKDPLLILGISIASGFLGASLGYERYQEVLELFKKKGERKKVLDTSIIIDGRIVDVIKAGFLEGEIVLPRFVLNELQAIADLSDPLKRNRGRRGFEVLKKLKKETAIHIIEEDPIGEAKEVDRKLIILAKKIGGVILTCDYNLSKVAQIEGISILNINDLIQALKPIILPGEVFSIQVVKEGKDFGQGLGYLEDGTMVIIEDGSDYLGKKIKAEVSNVLQSPTGRIIFTKVSK